MYSTCLHCNAKLGANEVVEAFPVGRRLVFDGAKGRLWVVCPRCHRWNLTPLEERWEAIEECERQFRATRLRASTDNIGLTRTREGLELVRVGKPNRPEIAAWRYARELQQRWRRVGLPMAGVGAGLIGLQMLSFTTSIGMGDTAALGGIAFVYFLQRMRLHGARVADADGRVVKLNTARTNSASLVPDGNRGWALRWNLSDDAPVTGAAARRGLRAVLTATNFDGARPRRVEGALRLLEEAGSAEAYIRHLAKVAPSAGINRMVFYPAEIKLALEMALQDESERLATKAELAELESDWRLAEEIAEIADGLMLPPGVLQHLTRLKGGSAG